MPLKNYFKQIYNNTRYIVFLQTKYHQNILPADDVSAHSLGALLETIWSYRWWVFRSIRIYRDDITTIKIYEMNFMNYKANVLKLSKNWRKIFEKLSFITWILNYILYVFVYLKEVDKFWRHITNNKPKYLIDKTEIALKILYWKEPKEYPKNKDWKEKIKAIDCHNWKLVINKTFFVIDTKKEIKADYFLKLFALLVEKEEKGFTEEYEFIEFYEKRYEQDWFNYDYLNLSTENIRKSYIQTINKNILKKYDREIIEIKDWYISLLLD